MGIVADTVDVTEPVALADAEAVRARRGAMEAGAGNLRGVTVEIETANGGAVMDVTSHRSW